MTATTALILSSLWSLKTSVMLHLKTIKINKGFFGVNASIAVFLWGLMGSFRRISAMIFFFVPSLGLFNLLNHWLAELHPFGIRKQFNLIHPKDQVHLYNLTESLLWQDLDRWNYYGDVNEPTQPPYTLYTGLTLKWTFVTFAFIMFFHALSMMMVKLFTSQEFKEEGNTFNKLMHVLQNIHCSFPYKDWDEDEGKSATKEEFSERFQNTENEMTESQLLNIGASIIMLNTSVVHRSVREAFNKKNHFLIDIRQ